MWGVMYPGAAYPGGEFDPEELPGYLHLKTEIRVVNAAKYKRSIKAAVGRTTIGEKSQAGGRVVGIALRTKAIMSPASGPRIIFSKPGGTHSKPTRIVMPQQAFKRIVPNPHTSKIETFG